MLLSVSSCEAVWKSCVLICFNYLHVWCFLTQIRHGQTQTSISASGAIEAVEELEAVALIHHLSRVLSYDPCPVTLRPSSMFHSRLFRLIAAYKLYSSLYIALPCNSNAHFHIHTDTDANQCVCNAV